jgi:hypothetical protein
MGLSLKSLRKAFVGCYFYDSAYKNASQGQNRPIFAISVD